MCMCPGYESGMVSNPSFDVKKEWRIAADFRMGERSFRLVSKCDAANAVTGTPNHTSSDIEEFKSGKSDGSQRRVIQIDTRVSMSEGNG
jgi:hypothetical protein